MNPHDAGTENVFQMVAAPHHAFVEIVSLLLREGWYPVGDVETSPLMHRLWMRRDPWEMRLRAMQLKAETLVDGVIRDRENDDSDDWKTSRP